MKKFETIQEAADYAVLKIVEQGGRCVDENGDCDYKCIIDGAKNHCAIGYLVCDSENICVEGAIGDVINEFSDSVNYQLIKSNLKFFHWLQSFHDHEYKGLTTGSLTIMKQYIDTSKPQYKQWVEMV